MSANSPKPRQSIALGELSAPWSRNDRLGGKNTQDYYRFQLTQRSSLSLSTPGLKRNAKVELVGSTRQPPTTQTAQTRTWDALEPGTYTLKLTQRQPSRYRIQLVPTLLFPNPAPTEFTDTVEPPLDRSWQASLDQAGSAFGQPISGYVEIGASLFGTTGQSRTYEQATLYWAANYGAIALPNATHDFYASQGGTAGWLGLPTQAPYDWNGGTRTDFEGGYLFQSPAETLALKFGETPTSIWFEQTLQDPNLRATATALFSDRTLDRQDWLTLLRDSQDDNRVDAVELADLRNLVNNEQLTTPAHVRNLAHKVVNGDRANQNYRGTALGNLQANSSANHMERLIDKWFLGGDRPLAQADNGTVYSYEWANGALFQNGTSYQDIYQGELGDCYYLASLAATALHWSDSLQQMFIDNGDNTYTVRFFKPDGTADYVTVDRYLPSDFGYFVYAQSATGRWSELADPANELWVALAEKAYAQVNESGWLQQNSTNSFFGIEGGWSNNALRHITGRTSSDRWSFSFNDMLTAHTQGQVMTLGSKQFTNQVAANIVPNHQYVVIDYQAVTQRFQVFNPWGIGNTAILGGQAKPGLLELSFDEIAASFDALIVTT